jgi:hypothetical protein
MAEQADYTGGSHVPSGSTGRAGRPLPSGLAAGNGGGPGSAAGSWREQLGGLKTEARRETVRIAEDARDQVGALVRRRKQLVAERLGSIASALREAGLRLEREADSGSGSASIGAARPRVAAAGGGAGLAAAEGGTRPAAPAAPAAVGLDAATRGLSELVDRAAEQVSRASDYLSDSDVKDLLHDLEGFARRRPAAFVGGSLAAGFVLARFFKSSGERRETT